MENEKGLTPQNLAILGIYETFYCTYAHLCELFDEHINQDLLEKRTPDFVRLNSEMKFIIREQCQRLVNSQLYLFTPEDITFHAGKPFDNIEFCWSYGMYEHVYMRFDIFLLWLQKAINETLYKRFCHKNPGYPRGFFIHDQEKRIDQYVNLSKKRLLESTATAPAEKVSGDCLYLYTNLTSVPCHNHRNEVVARVFPAKTSDDDTINLPVHYCTRCQKIYIGKETLKLLEKNYGKILVEKRNAVEHTSTTYSFKEESKLHMLGYNVVEGNMSETQRHHLLAALISSEQITYTEVCETIEQNIRLSLNQPNRQRAVLKWKSDLKYISEYMRGTKS